MVTPQNDKPARTICAEILTRWLDTQEFPERMLPHHHAANALIQEITFGCLRWYGTLRWRVMQMASRDPDPVTMGFLLIGMYQLFHMDHIPTHAAVHETVEAAKGKLDPARCRFVNGVLRNAIRQKEQMEKKLLDAPIHVRFSHPKQLVQGWNKQFGPDATQKLCQWNNKRPTNSLRVFPGRDPAAQLLLDELPPHPASPEYFRLVPSGQAIQEIKGFEEGAFYVQDPATEIAVNLLAPEPGMTVLDACAAPGGKTFACAERMQNKGKIIALDKHQDRLQQMTENMDRMQFTIIKLQRGDATKSSQLPPTPFDRILLDVPCSNSGVLQRRPDARWRISKERISALTSMQHHFLDATAPLLATDGVLVYSTCSLEAAENLECVTSWLEKNQDFVLRATRSSVPPESGMDGAFAARIERKPQS